MKNRDNVKACLSLLALAIMGCGSTTQPAFAGHHFETPLAKKFPHYDMTDVYVFDSDRKDHTAVVLKFNPHAKSADFINAFGTDGYYSIHFGADKSMTSGVAFSFTFADGKVRMHQVGKAVPELGELGQEIGSGDINTSFTIEGVAGSSVRIWTGVGPDPFPGNGKGLNLWKNAALKGEYLKDAYKDGEDLFGNFEAAMISFDIPNSLLPKKVHYYASAAHKNEGKWQQVNRIGYVLMPHIFLSNKDYEEINAEPPQDDVKSILKSAATLERWVAVAGRAPDPKSYAMEMAKKLLPDVVPYVPGTPAQYTVNIDEMNGRRVNDDAMNVAVTWMTGGAITDDNCYIKPERVSAFFPFVVGKSNNK